MPDPIDPTEIPADERPEGAPTETPVEPLSDDEAPASEDAPAEASLDELLAELGDGATPEVVPTPDDSDAGLAETVGRSLTWIPYATYLGAWLALAGASAYLLKDATPESPARWMPAYAIIVWTGVGLTALGPLLSLGVWLVARRRRPEHARRGLLVSALMRGALTAVFGVVIWAATIYVLELVATGVLS